MGVQGKQTLRAGRHAGQGLRPTDPRALQTFVS